MSRATRPAMRTTLSKTKKAVTARWLELLPALGSVKPLFLVRRHGSLLCGVCLDATLRPDAFVPRAFFHDLAQPFPVISITAAAPARDARQAAMEVAVDDRAKAAAAAEALLAAHPWLRSPRLTLAEVADHVADYVAGRFGGVVPFQTGPVELVLHACASLGRPDLATAVREAALAQMAGWPPRAFNIIRSPQAWAERTKHPCTPGAGASLRTVVEAQAAQHAVATLPELPLLLEDLPAFSRPLC